jgi:hypothetical protein
LTTPITSVASEATGFEVVRVGFTSAG